MCQPLPEWETVEVRNLGRGEKDISGVALGVGYA